MVLDKLSQIATEFGEKANIALTQPETYTQLGIIFVIYVLSFFLSNLVRKYAPLS